MAELPRRHMMQGVAVMAAAAGIGGPARADSEAAIVAEEHWARKGDVQLYMYRKRQAGQQGPVLFLVHGSSFSGRGGFDLHVPGHPGYSMMDEFAAQGFDVWTMDHENYGRSSRTEAISDIASGVADLAAAMPVVEQATGAKRVMMYGQSGGSLRAGRFAMEAPERVERLVLDAFTYTGEGAAEIMRRRAVVAQLQAERFRPSTPDTFVRIFSRDDPSTFEPAVAKALGDYELKLTDRTPNGTYIDMAIHMPQVEPAKLTCPVLIIRAAFDANATDAELLAFFAALPNKDRQFAFVDGVAHVAVLGINRHRVWHVMSEFLTYPAKV